MPGKAPVRSPEPSTGRLKAVDGVGLRYPGEMGGPLPCVLLVTNRAIVPFGPVSRSIGNHDADHCEIGGYGARSCNRVVQ